MKKIKVVLILIVLVLAAVVGFNYPRLNIITGFAAKSVCSCTFEAGRDQISIEAGDNDIDPIYYAKNVIDTIEKSVTSTVFGLKKRKAVYKEGIGCVLLSENEVRPNFQPKRRQLSNDASWPYGDGKQIDTLFENINYSLLNKTVDSAFDYGSNVAQRTRAVVVVYKDQIIAEKYAPGFDKNTKILGWSMTKSVTNAVFGVLEKNGELDIDEQNLFPTWEQDGRSVITLRNLLNMNSGLEWLEDYNTMSDVTNMLFMESDMGKVQVDKPLTGPPNASWNYSSGTTNLLSLYLRNQFDSHKEYLDFWYLELIERIGMHSMIIETDISGTYVGSSYGWATPRDWAKFGLLYLHKGNWNGEQILNESWVEFSHTPTDGSEGSYGAQFWLNAGGMYPDAPKDIYFCNGYQGQQVVIIPSKEMVIVRMGLTEYPDFDFNSFLSNISKSVTTTK
jgi:CubicO group peptidase (beta-lactamase class C family)